MHFYRHPAGKQWLIYRSSRPGLPNLPLTVQSVGCYEMNRGWYEGPIRKWFLEIFWTLSGRGAFKVDGEWIPVRPGDIFIYRPGEYHELKSEAEQWRYGWITFDHADADRWLEGFGLTNRLHQAGECPVELLEEIAEQLLTCLPEGERRAASLAHDLLVNASSGATKSKESSPANHAKKRMDASYADPLFGISEIAKELKIHRTTLFRLFHQQFGLTPSRYLQNLRMQKALSMLRESSEPIQEVGRLCGFRDANYFSRSVRRATGMSPREFRRGRGRRYSGEGGE
jgi:AraC-like DNA-binding protein